MSGFSADNLLAAAAVWVAIMLPSAAFGHDPVSEGVVAQRCHASQVQAQSSDTVPDLVRIGSDRAA
ncbi:hypothetical protein [Kaistia sp. UC242_56]|uniref:hypothetical protein n=1 Tax=Kaistia sp. UC242_56 TaxID=3374625 RepID=UPI00379D3CAB